jgi:hypothetical protein
VIGLARRLPALLLTFALVASQAGVCAGWMPTAEARMACCSESGMCPMRKADSRESASRRVITQAQADSCCAASEREQSSQSPETFVVAISSAVLGPSVVIPAPVPALVLSAARRTVAPLPASQVPKHVLLSVFLL